MAIEAELADGRILEFPDGTDPLVIQQAVKSMLAQQPAQQVTQPQTDEQFKELSLFEQFKQLQPDQSKIAREQILEPAVTIGTGAAGEIAGGLTGLATAPFVGTEQAQRNIEATQEALTVQPFTPGGEQALQAIGGAVQTGMEAARTIPAGLAGIKTLATGGGVEQAGRDIAEVKEKGLSKSLGDFTLDLTGSPAAAAAVHSIPTLAVELIGLKGLQNVRKGTRLIDDAGRPTKQLRKSLDQRGLDFDSLSPEAKAAIPDVSDPAFLPGANAPAGASEKALIQQIKSGGREDALAGLKVAGDRVGVDKLGVEAIKQGFEPSVVQSVKTSNAATKAKMRKMVGKMRKIKKIATEGVTDRPSNVVGDAVTDRIKFIRDKADVARKELNDIADTKLRGKDIDIAPVTAKLQESLNDLDIELVDSPSGIPKPEFKGSMISKDKTSQRVITDLVDLLSEGGKPDALRAHKLKRQLDIMIDFNKKSAEGLTDAGRNILKDIRAELNNSIRNVDVDYARVNDTLSQSLGALGDLDDVIGKIDMFGKGANSAIGTKMRTLLSNQVGRENFRNAIIGIEDTANRLGGKFTDNLNDLTMFADALDSRFGTTAKTSLAGQTEQAVRQAAEQGVTRAAFQKTAETLGKGAEKLRGVNEFNAFESMNSLLNR